MLSGQPDESSPADKQKHRVKMLTLQVRRQKYMCIPEHPPPAPLVSASLPTGKYSHDLSPLVILASL